MRRRVLLDTNILLDSCMSERPDWQYAIMLLDEIAFGELDACIASASLKDVYFVLGKYADEPTARQFVDAALDAFTVVDIDVALCRTAVRSDEPDYEDGIIRACAEREDADFIISRDEAAFARSPIKRLSAREYVELFCDAEEVELDR